jgi:hypothetical protein
MTSAERMRKEYIGIAGKSSDPEERRASPSLVEARRTPPTPALFSEFQG